MPRRRGPAPPRLDAAGLPLVELAIVEVRYRGTWRRGRLLLLHRKTADVELYRLHRPGLITTRLPFDSLYLVAPRPPAAAPSSPPGGNVPAP